MITGVRSYFLVQEWNPTTNELSELGFVTITTLGVEIESSEM